MYRVTGNWIVLRNQWVDVWLATAEGLLGPPCWYISMSMSVGGASRGQIEEQLTRITSSRFFASAPRQRQFLEFVVSRYLDGDSANLKESTIGVFVFGKAPGYDSNADTIVRTTASRVRRKLNAYYDNPGRGDRYVIELSEEGYIPRIRLANLALRSPIKVSTTQADQIPHDLSVGGDDLAQQTLHDPGAARLRQHTPPSPMLMAISGIGVVLLAAVLLLSGMPRVESSRSIPKLERLTWDGLGKVGPLWTDGIRVYFTEVLEGRAQLASVSLSGGVVTRIAVPTLIESTLLDARLPGPEFLLLGSSRGGEKLLWSWHPGRAPHALLRARATEGAAWMSESSFVYASPEGTLNFIDHGRLRKEVTLPGVAARPRYLSGQFLVFLVCDTSAERCQLWRMRDPEAAPHPVPGFTQNIASEAWSPEGNSLAFVTAGTGGSDIWTIESASGQWPASVPPTRLVSGPYFYEGVLPVSRIGKAFAIGGQHSVDLLFTTDRSTASGPISEESRLTKLIFRRMRHGWHM